MSARWHSIDQAAVLGALRVEVGVGLDVAEVERRLSAHGGNTLPEAELRGAWRTLLAQFRNLMVGVLAGAAVLAGVVGEPLDAIAIAAILLLNAALGFVQERRAEQAVAALKSMAPPQARVRRAGAVRSIDAAQLVPGDIVRLEAGDLVPADLRLVDVVQLRVTEAALTGEAEAVAKQVDAVADSAALADRLSMAFKGTTVAQGRAWGVVVETGARTELGRIATLLTETEATQTPLQRRLATFTSRLALAIAAICAMLFVVGLLHGEPAGLMFLTAVSLAVAAIPEALPAVVTVALALGARRAAARQALIRHLPAVEALGSVTYICTDKTGTLTENRMRVAAIHPATPPPRELWLALALSNDVELAPDGTWRGDPTEVALVERASSEGFGKAALVAAFPRLAEVPFTSERSAMTTLHRDGARAVSFTKGAPERVLAACASAWSPAGAMPLDAAREVPALLAAAESMARDGMRVLAIAHRDWASGDERPSQAVLESGLQFLALVGLLDPPRGDAAAAVAECQRAGIRVVMVTGDHPATADAIARALGIRDGVHARVTPEEKLRIVEALQARGEFVAMTGDGVNDAPALKRANIGVAMGRSGTDVAREASDLILLDDRFATIVSAVREGRRIYDNIRKFVRYALTCNSAELWTLVLAPMVGLPIPLLPIHILWVNLVTDGLPGIALGLEPADARTMRRPPRAPSESIFARGLWQHAVWVGALMGGATLALQAIAWRAGWHWQSMTFTVLAMLQLGHLLAIRSEEAPGWTGLRRNPWLVAAVVLTVVLQLLLLYVPQLNRIFRTEPLSAMELATCALFASVGFIAVELEKWTIRRRGATA